MRLKLQRYCLKPNVKIGHVHKQKNNDFINNKTFFFKKEKEEHIFGEIKVSKMSTHNAKLPLSLFILCVPKHLLEQIIQLAVA